MYYRLLQRLQSRFGVVHLVSKANKRCYFVSFFEELIMFFRFCWFWYILVGRSRCRVASFWGGLNVIFDFERPALSHISIFLRGLSVFWSCSPTDRNSREWCENVGLHCCQNLKGSSFLVSMQMLTINDTSRQESGSYTSKLWFTMSGEDSSVSAACRGNTNG